MSRIGQQPPDVLRHVQLVGGGLDFQMGRSLKFGRIAHNRLLMSFAHGFGHPVKTFGNPDYCGDGPLSLT